MELFDKRFVHFMWDDELNGKEGFIADDICELTNCVHSGNMHLTKVKKSLSPAFPFKDTNNNDWLFFYYDPNYEVKKAFNEGKKVQVKKIDSFVDWVDCDEPLWSEDCLYRINPEEEKWIVYLARQKDGVCYLTACSENNWEFVQKIYGAKTKLFVGSENEVREWYRSREKFKDLIKAWEDGKTIQVYETLFKKWGDCAGTLEWYTECEYRVKPDCPCEDGIDSKACVGCEHSEDGKRKYKPYVTVDEFLQDYQERFPTAVPRPAHTMPLIWLTNIVSEEIHLVTGFNMTDENENEKGVCIRDIIWSFRELFSSWTFLDGNPCGMEVKE